MVVQPDRESTARLSSKHNVGRIRQALHRICWANGVMLLGFIVAMRIICWPRDLPPTFADAQPLFILLTFLSLIANALIAGIPIRVGLGVSVSLISASCVLVVCHFLSINLVPSWMAELLPGARAKVRAPIARREVKTIGIYQFDPVCGFGHKPGSQGIHERFTVTYTLDDQGCRVTPTPAMPEGTVVITGCSFTFGYGVEDSECYPAILAREHWSNLKVRNRAVCGYGTVHAYLQVLTELEHEDHGLPSLVLYAMIPDHVRRNYLRESWVGHVTRGRFLRGEPADLLSARRGHPHFELIDGELVSKGLIDFEDAVEDSPCLRYPEAVLTEAFLVGTYQRCSDKGVPFVVVLLPEGFPNETNLASIRKMLKQHAIPNLDLSDLPMQTLADGLHPNQVAHRSFAEEIARSFGKDFSSTEEDETN